MYKLLFAEDESATRMGILESVPWEELGIGEVRAEKNGALAYKTAQTFCPDILLTDIKMPRMNGIELSQKIREINPECSILIISGYSEVDYLKSAIQLQAINFVDKPIDLDVLIEELRNAVAAQDGIHQKKSLLETELASLLRYSGFSVNRVKTLLKELYPDLPEQSYGQAILVQILTKQGYRVIEAGLYDVLCQSRKIMESQPYSYALGLHKGCLQLSLFSDKKDFSFDFNLLQQELNDYQLYFCAGPVMPVSEYEQSLLVATWLLPAIAYDQSNHVLIRKDLIPVGPEMTRAVDLQPFSQCVLERDRAGTKNFVHKTIEEIRMNRSLSPSRAAELCFTMLIQLLPEGPDYSQELSKESASEWLRESIFLERMEQELLMEIDKKFDSFQNDTGRFPMEQILIYIHEHYADKELSLNQLSQQFYLSNVYLCIKFKETMGKTFVRYLTEYRIQKSIYLLHNASLKINDIAEQVGFGDGSYFTKIFKKEMGMTPAEFRKKTGE